MIPLFLMETMGKPYLNAVCKSHKGKTQQTGEGI